MSFATKYIDRQQLLNQLEIPFKESSQIAVVIPCNNEPEFIHTLQSVWKTKPIERSIELIVVVNHSQDDANYIKVQNRETVAVCNLFSASNQREDIQLHVLQLFDIKKKLAGVGYARKAGMDQAIIQFNQHSTTQGILLSLDADTLVSENYFSAIDHFYQTNKKAVGATIYFEHREKGNNAELTEAPLLYELYLRYYKNALNFTGFPYAYHTVGSCFSCTAERYVLQGGMGKQQGGEDFYFLNKLFPTGLFGQITNTCVYPSARVSNRVPFGTGPAIARHLNDGSLYKTYAWELFLMLKQFFTQFPEYYNCNEKRCNDLIHLNATGLVEFLKQNKFAEMVRDATKNTTSLPAFTKRLFFSFNAFQVVKFLNFASEAFIPKEKVEDQVNCLLVELGSSAASDPVTQLNILRSLDRGVAIN